MTTLRAILSAILTLIQDKQPNTSHIATELLRK